jgi:hypothetical protein
MPNSESQLINTAAGMAAMFEAYQGAIVGRVTELLAPVQLGQAEQRAMLEELRTLFTAMQGQIDQIHLRQEQLERMMMRPLRRDLSDPQPHQGEP